MKEELERRLADLERSEFYLEMKDFWDSEDWAISVKYDEEIKSIKNQLKNL